MQTIFLALFGPRAARWLSLGMLCCALLISGFLFFMIVTRQQPFEHWLIWRYLGYWAGALVFALACLSAGHRVNIWLSPGYRTDGHWVLAFASGVLLFFLVMFGCGVLRILNVYVFVAVPVVLIAFGIRSLVQELVPAIRHWLRRPFQVRPWELIACGFGALSLAAIYLPILSPANISYDSRWYHLGLAENFVAAGAILPSSEGTVAAAAPHLASILYTWAMLLPVGQIFDRVELAAHLEAVIFLGTLPGIPLLCRELNPAGMSFRWAWVARFLFPAVFIYDTSLVAGADHVASLWAIPIWLSCMRAMRTWSLKDWGLLALYSSGLLLTKLTAVILLVPLLGIIGIRCFQSILNDPSRGARRVLSALSIALLTSLVLTTPYWLKNWLWYGNPVYPMLNQYFHSTLWTPDSTQWYQIFLSNNFRPIGSWDSILLKALRSLFDYSFALYNWHEFHYEYPVFGSLFTFLLVIVLFLRLPARLLVLIASVHVAIFVWFYMSHQERYLTVLVPWMAAAIVLLLVSAWRTRNIAVRVALIAVLAVHLGWSSDIPFYPTHRMHGGSGIGFTAGFLSSGFRRDYRARLAVFTDWQAIGDSLPRKSKVLIHNDHGSFGINQQTVKDAIPAQLGLNYGRLGSPEAVHAHLKKIGVTHLAWHPDASDADSVAGELLFRVTAHDTENQRSVSGVRLGELATNPPKSLGRAVLYLGCGGTYASGLYELADLAVPGRLWDQIITYPTARRPLQNEGELPELLRAANYAVIEPGCSATVKLDGFQLLGRRPNHNGMQLYAHQKIFVR